MFDLVTGEVIGVDIAPAGNPRRANHVRNYLTGVVLMPRSLAQRRKFDLDTPFGLPVRARGAWASTPEAVVRHHVPRDLLNAHRLRRVPREKRAGFTLLPVQPEDRHCRRRPQWLPFAEDRVEAAVPGGIKPPSRFPVDGAADPPRSPSGDG